MGPFRPSAQKIVEEIFKEFTPEEMEILDSESSGFPFLYSRLIKTYCPLRKAKYDLEVTKGLASHLIYPLRNQLKDPNVQYAIFKTIVHELLKEKFGT